MNHRISKPGHSQIHNRPLTMRTGLHPTDKKNILRTENKHGTSSYQPPIPKTSLKRLLSSFHRRFVPLANPRHKEHDLCPPLPCVSSKDRPWIRPRPCRPRSPRSSASSA